MEPAITFVTIGALLVVALLADMVGRRTSLPQVTLLLLVGVVAGPVGLNVLPAAREAWQPVVTDIALVMVGFLVGSDLRWEELRGRGPSILLLAGVAAVMTAAMVSGGIWVLGGSLPLALALGGLSAATDPAATLAVVDEQDADGPLTRTLLGVVAVDDAYTITLFSLLLATAVVVTGSGDVGSILLEALREIGGGLLLGVAVGFPAALVTGRLQDGRPTLLEALALVFLTAGLGILLGVSFLLAAIVAGALVANLAPHHEHAFREIERIDWPFLASFFVLAGASFTLEDVRTQAGWIAAFVLLRTVGKMLGGVVGARLAGSPREVRRWVGASLLPQAGVTLGLALLSSERFPEIAAVVVPVVVVSTVIFELVGPIAAGAGLKRTGETGAGA